MSQLLSMMVQRLSVCVRARDYDMMHCRFRHKSLIICSDRYLLLHSLFCCCCLPILFFLWGVWRRRESEYIIIKDVCLGDLCVSIIIWLLYWLQLPLCQVIWFQFKLCLFEILDHFYHFACNYCYVCLEDFYKLFSWN